MKENWGLQAADLAQERNVFVQKYGLPVRTSLTRADEIEYALETQLLGKPKEHFFAMQDLQEPAQDTAKNILLGSTKNALHTALPGGMAAHWLRKTAFFRGFGATGVSLARQTGAAVLKQSAVAATSMGIDATTQAATLAEVKADLQSKGLPGGLMPFEIAKQNAARAVNRARLSSWLEPDFAQEQLKALSAEQAKVDQFNQKVRFITEHFLQRTGLARTEKDGFWYDLGGAAASVLGSIGALVLTRNPYVGAVIFGAAEGQSSYEAAVEAGIAPQDAYWLAQSNGAWIAATELIGDKLFSKLLYGKGILGKYSKAILEKTKQSPKALQAIAVATTTTAEGGLIEAAQETTQNVGTDLIHKYSGVEDKKTGQIIKDALYAGMLAFVLGGLPGGLVGLGQFRKYTENIKDELAAAGVEEKEAENLARETALTAIGSEFVGDSIKAVSAEINSPLTAEDRNPAEFARVMSQAQSREIDQTAWKVAEKVEQESLQAGVSPKVAAATGQVAQALTNGIYRLAKLTPKEQAHFNISILKGAQNRQVPAFNQAAAAMYKSPHKEFSKFYETAQSNKGKKQSYYTYTTKSGIDMDIPSDTILHDKKHPEMDAKMWANALSNLDNIKHYYLVKPRVGIGVGAILHLEDDFGAEITIQPNNRILLNTAFKGTSKGIEAWINKAKENARMSAPLRRGQASQSEDVVSSRSPIYSLADIVQEIKGKNGSSAAFNQAAAAMYRNPAKSLAEFVGKAQKQKGQGKGSYFSFYQKDGLEIHLTNTAVWHDKKHVEMTPEMWEKAARNIENIEDYTFSSEKLKQGQTGTILLKINASESKFGIALDVFENGRIFAESVFTGTDATLDQWLQEQRTRNKKIKAAGSPAPHFIGVGQALQKSKDVLSGQPSKYSLADILEEIKPGKSTKEIISAPVYKTFEKEWTEADKLKEKVTLEHVARTLEKRVQPTQGSKDSINNNSQIVKGITWAQALEGVADNSGAYLPTEIDDKAVQIKKTYYQLNNLTQIHDQVTGQSIDLTSHIQGKAAEKVTPIPITKNLENNSTKKGVRRKVLGKNTEIELTGKNGKKYILSTSSVDKMYSSIFEHLSGEELSLKKEIIAHIGEIFPKMELILSHKDIKGHDRKIERFAAVVRIDEEDFYVMAVAKNGKVGKFEINSLYDLQSQANKKAPTKIPGEPGHKGLIYSVGDLELFVKERIAKYNKNYSKNKSQTYTQNPTNPRGMVEIDENSVNIKKTFYQKIEKDLFEVDDEIKKAVEKDVSQCVQGKLPVWKEIELGLPSIALKQAGIPDYQLRLKQKTIKKDVQSKHAVKLSTIQNLPSLLADPLLILKSETESGSFVLALKDTDLNGKRIIAAIDPEGVIEINYIDSVYGKDDPYWFKKQVEKGNLLYIDEKEAQKESSHLYLRGVPYKASDNRILTKEDIVKAQALKTYHQTPADPRGMVEIDEQAHEAVIRVFEQADPSTIVHELAHIYLTMLHESAKVSMDEDFQKLMEDIDAWLGEPNGADGSYSVEQQEQFARGFESYLAQGKAPNKELENVFEKFAAWLAEIYESVKDFLQISPEVSSIFDRLLTTQEPIKRSKIGQKVQAAKELAQAMKKGFGQDIDGVRVADMKELLRTLSTRKPPEPKEHLLKDLRKYGADYANAALVDKEAYKNARVFDKKGGVGDNAAQWLMDKGYLSEQDAQSYQDQSDLDQAAADMIERALGGEKIYKLHDRARAEERAAYEENLNTLLEIFPDIPTAKESLRAIALLESQGYRAVEKKDLQDLERMLNMLGKMTERLEQEELKAQAGALERKALKIQEDAKRIKKRVLEELDKRQIAHKQNMQNLLKNAQTPQEIYAAAEGVLEQLEKLWQQTQEGKQEKRQLEVPATNWAQIQVKLLADFTRISQGAHQEVAEAQKTLASFFGRILSEEEAKQKEKAEAVLKKADLESKYVRAMQRAMSGVVHISTADIAKYTAFLARSTQRHRLLTKRNVEQFIERAREIQLRNYKKYMTGKLTALFNRKIFEKAGTAKRLKYNELAARFLTEAGKIWNATQAQAQAEYAARFKTLDRNNPPDGFTALSNAVLSLKAEPDMAGAQDYYDVYQTALSAIRGDALEKRMEVLRRIVQEQTLRVALIANLQERKLGKTQTAYILRGGVDLQTYLSMVFGKGTFDKYENAQETSETGKEKGSSHYTGDKSGSKEPQRTGANGQVSTDSAATQTLPTFSRQDLGAVLKSINSIADNKQNFKAEQYRENIINKLINDNGHSLLRNAKNRKEASAHIRSFQGRDLINKETGITAVVNTNQKDKLVSKKALTKSLSNGFTAQEHYSVVSNMDILYENAYLWQSRTDRDNDVNIKSIKEFYTPVNFGTRKGYAFILLKESVEEGHRIYTTELQEIKSLQGINVGTSVKDSIPALVGINSIASKEQNFKAEQYEIDFREELSPENEQMQAAVFKHQSRQKLVAAAMKAYGLNSADQVIDKMTELQNDKMQIVSYADVKDEQSGEMTAHVYKNGKVYTDSGAKQQTITREEILTFWLWDQDHVFDENGQDYGLSGRLTRAYGRAQLEQMFAKLTPQDKAFGTALQDLLAQVHQLESQAHRRIYGFALPHKEHYFPSVTDRNDDSIDYKQQIVDNAKAPSFIKERVKSGRPKQQRISPVKLVLRHLDRAGEFIFEAEKYAKLRRVVNNTALKNAFENKFGEKDGTILYKKLQDLVVQQGPAPLKTKDELFDLTEKAFNGWVKAALGAKIMVGVKQFASSISFAEQMPAHLWAKWFAEGLSRPLKTAQYMKELSPYIQVRYESGGVNEAVARAMVQEEIRPIATRWNNLTNLLLLNTRMGDKASLIYGGYPYVKYLTEVKGLTQERAAREFEKQAVRTLQSSLKANLSMAQAKADSLPWRLFLTFKNQQMQYVRRLADSYTQYQNKEISLRQFGKMVLIYLVLNPLVYTLLSLGYLADDDDERQKDFLRLMSAPVSQFFDAWPFYGAAAEYLLQAAWQCVQGEELPAPQRIGTPAIDDFYRDVSRAVKAVNDDDVEATEFMTAFMEFAKYFGLPLGTFGNIAGGVKDITQGEVTRGSLRVAGFSKKRAEKITGTEE